MNTSMLPQFAYPITFLPCRDLDAVRHFYEAILHLPVALEQARCILFKIGQVPHYTYWGFCDHSHSQEFLSPPEKVCLTLVVATHADVDRWHQELQNHQIQYTKIPSYTPEYKIYNGFYVDPMGYTLEIQAFDEEGRPEGG